MYFCVRTAAALVAWHRHRRLRDRHRLRGSRHHARVVRAGTAVLEQLAPAADARAAVTSRPDPCGARCHVCSAPAPQSVRREAAMTPWPTGGTDVGAECLSVRSRAYGEPPPRNSAPLAQSLSRATAPTPLDSDDDEPRVVGTFRTVCVRLCDGYYFPVSFAIDGGPPRARSGRVREPVRGAGASVRASQSRRLLRRPAAISPAGPTASCARRSSIAPSTCRAAPASPSPGSRPRRTATASTRWPHRPGRADKDAAKELQALQTKVKEARQAGRAGRYRSPGRLRPTACARARPAAGSAKAAEIAAREDGTFMGLGGDGAPKPKTEPAPLKSSPNTDWIRRAFDR